jgi:hypothetical protein
MEGSVGKIIRREGGESVGTHAFPYELERGLDRGCKGGREALWADPEDMRSRLRESAK